MNGSCSTTLMHIQLILNGAIRRYEEEGRQILSKLHDEECKRLSVALESIGEALYWASQKAESALVHEIDEAMLRRNGASSI